MGPGAGPADIRPHRNRYDLDLRAVRPAGAGSWAPGASRAILRYPTATGCERNRGGYLIAALVRGLAARDNLRRRLALSCAVQAGRDNRASPLLSNRA